MENNKISVAFVTYDNLENLEKSYRSITGMEELIVEIIVIDSSTDMSIRTYVKNITEYNVKYEWEAAQGIYHAMNSALKLANSGSYIWYLNPADELINRNVLVELLFKTKDEKFSWGFAQAVKELNDKKEIYPPKPIRPTLENIASGRLSISHQAMLVKVAALKDVGGFDEKYEIASDLKMQIQLARNFLPVTVFKPLVSIDPTGISHNKQMKTYIETFKVRFFTSDFSKLEVFYLTLRNLTLKVFMKLYKVCRFSK